MKINSQQITFVALFLALSLIVPLLFHLIGVGSMFLPMFLPIVLSGFLIEFPTAMVVGFLAPWISSFATGMPPLFPTALLMSVEGIVAAGTAAYLYHNRRLSFWICLIAAIFAERIVLVLMIILIVPLINLPPTMFSIGVIIYSIPGVILQLVLIPIILKILWKLKIIEQK